MNLSVIAIRYSPFGEYPMIYVDNWQSIRNTITLNVPCNNGLQIWRFISVSWNFPVFLLKHRVYGIFFFCCECECLHKQVKTLVKTQRSCSVALQFFLNETLLATVNMHFSYTFNLNELCTKQTFINKYFACWIKENLAICLSPVSSMALWNVLERHSH